MPVGRPPQQETPLIVRQIPRAVSLDAVAAPEEPPNDPPEPFFEARPSEPEPEPEALRPLRSLVRDTIGFVARQWPKMLLVAAPAAALVIFAGLVRWGAYERLVAPADANRRSIAGFALISMVSGWVTALGIYFQTIAVAFLVRQHAQGRSTQSGAACAWALRRLPRVVTANVVYGLLVAAVFGAPLVFLGLYLSERDVWLLQPWTYLIAGVIAYTAPQVNVYFSAIKLEERRPKFRWARKLCRGQAAAIWGRVLLWQLIYVAFLAMWQIVAPEPWSVGSVSLSVIYLVVPGAILTTAYTYIYVDLAGIARDGRGAVDEGGTGDILQVPARA